MAFNWNRFPYTNFHELNLDWFNEHFKEIFEEWDSLFDQMINWRNNTDRDLALWKNEVLENMEQWESNLLNALNEWKSTTGEDIEEWESGVISDLNDWKDTFIDAYESLEDRVEAIVSDTEEMVENLAEPFSSSKNYLTGDYVVENGVLYRFTSDHNAGAWTGNDVIQTTATKEIITIRESLQKNYSPLVIHWTKGGYIDQDTGDVTAYQTWKYSDFIDLTNLTNGYFMAIKIADTAGTAFNCYYNANYEKIDGPFSITSEMRAIPYPLNAKYVRISANADEPVLLFDDRTPSKIKWYKELGSVNTFVTNIIDIEDPKYHIETPEGHTVSVISIKEDGTILNQSQYLGTRDYYRLYNTYKIQLKVHAESGYTIYINSDSVKSITCQPKKIYTPPKYLKIMSMNVGLWGDGTNPMADADVASKSITWHRMLGKNNCDIVACIEAPNNINAGNNVSWSTLFSNKYPYRYNDADVKMKVASKNTILNAEKLNFQSGSTRLFYTFELNVADVILTIFVVHLDPTAQSHTRAADMAEVATKLGQCEYGIAIGDWNNYSMSEITSAFSGFNICNGGVFGEFETWTPNESWPNGAIDNIITTSNISIENVYIESESLSDHKGLIAELNLYY